MAEIKYVEVPIRVKPHTDYLDMKGVEELWVKIKEYVREHGGEGGTVVGAVDEVEVNRIIREYYETHKNDLKGEPFTFADFTEEQLADLKIKGDKGEQGEKGEPFRYEDFTEEQLASLKGEKGDKGQDGTITFEELTEEQKATLKGEKGDVGAPFTYDMFTEAQLAALKGEKGDKGQDGTMVFEDLTDEQRATLKGEKGDRGEKGDTGAPFTYDMFTPEQLEALKVKGDKGDQGERGEKGDQGIQGIQGVQGVPGRAGEVDYTLVYRKTETYSKTEIDDKLKNVDFDIDLGELGNIDLDNYYDKAEIDTKFAAIEIEGATGVHLGDTEPENPLVTIWVDTDGIPYNGDEDLHELFYTKDEIDSKMENYKHNLSEMVNDIGFITEGDIPTRTSDLNNDAGFLTSQDVYTKGTVYTKDEVNALLSGFEPDTDFEMHDHANLGYLDKLGEKDGKLTYNGVEVAVGDVSVDLTGYATESALNNGLATKADKDHTHEEYITAEDVADITGGKLIKSMTYTYAYGADSKTKPTQWFATKAEASNAYTTQTYSWVKQTTTFSDGTSEEGFFVTMNTVNVPSEYVTETELANKKYLTAVPSEYITESELNAKGYLTAVPTHTHSQYLTEVPSEYITETELNNKNYTTKTYVDNAIANIDTSGSGGSGSGVGQTYGSTTAGEIFNDYTNNTAAEMAHAEGLNTNATGIRSHAEGQQTKSSGVASHAEGSGCEAKGHSSHAEGDGTVASGQQAHAEGWDTYASGGYSHAEGRGTIAAGWGQHAEGTYNISDSELLHIVGNGSSETNRSNAHTLDKNGNAWFAGKVYVGGTSMADATELGSGGGSVDLSDYYTKSQVDAKIPSLTNYYTKAQTNSAISTAISNIPTGGSSETWETIYENTFTNVTTDSLDTSLKEQAFNLEDYSKVRIVASYKCAGSSTSNSYVPGLRLYKSTNETKDKMNCYNSNGKMTGSGGLYGNNNYATFVGTIENYDDCYIAKMTYAGYDSSTTSSANTKSCSADIVATKLYGFDKFKIACIESTPSATLTMTIKFVGVRK